MLAKLSKKSSENQDIAKQYGVIFPRLSSRALHMELAKDPSTDRFVLVLCRFRPRRGYPKSIISNNSFKLDNSRIKDNLNTHYVDV